MNYYELDFESDYNPKLLSAKESCKNMSALSSTYTKQQNDLFVDKINIDICNYHNNYNLNVEEIKTNESELLKGFSINKKSCIYKRPEYDNGLWKDQYNSSDTFKNDINSYKLYDYQTKNKIKVINKN
jgi:hypothetical protein